MSRKVVPTETSTTCGGSALGKQERSWPNASGIRGGPHPREHRSRPHVVNAWLLGIAAMISTDNARRLIRSSGPSRSVSAPPISRTNRFGEAVHDAIRRVSCID